MPRSDPRNRFEIRMIRNQAFWPRRDGLYRPAVIAMEAEQELGRE
jgi:hypothetical protein